VYIYTVILFWNFSFLANKVNQIRTIRLQKHTLETYKPCSVRNPVEFRRWSLDWQTFHILFPGLWSWIRQHMCHHCEHTPSCIPSSSSCCWRPWVAEPWHIGHLRSLTWPAWISSCHKWTPLSLLILQWPAECWPTHNSAGNLAALLEYFCSNKKLLIFERASCATTWCQMTQWRLSLWRYDAAIPRQQRALAIMMTATHRTCLFVTLVYRLYFICNK